MGEVDDPHHAEDNRQPDADQRQAGDRVKRPGSPGEQSRSTFTIPKQI